MSQHSWQQCSVVRNCIILGFNRRLRYKNFVTYVKLSQQANKKSYLVYNNENHIVGVFNLSEIVRGLFQSAYLGFYAVADYAGQGYMSAGLKLVLEKSFTELALHRIEANVQPQNTNSIHCLAVASPNYSGNTFLAKWSLFTMLPAGLYSQTK
jgi:hypothetical protein